MDNVNGTFNEYRKGQLVSFLTHSEVIGSHIFSTGTKNQLITTQIYGPYVKWAIIICPQCGLHIFYRIFSERNDFLSNLVA